MPLSTVLGAQSLVQPAVCTTATRPASPYTGQAIYDTTISALLIWSGTAWTGTGGLQLVTTATCSSGGTAVGGVVTIGSAVSSVTVATAFSSTYDNYKIVVSGGVASTTCNLQLQLGSTITGYYSISQQIYYTNAATEYASQNNGTMFQSFGAGSTNSLQANCELGQPNVAKITTMSTPITQLATGGVGGIHTGFLNDSTQYTSFLIKPNTGTLTGGTIRVYGYQNS
jgi:hypothetical protein